MLKAIVTDLRPKYFESEKTWPFHHLLADCATPYSSSALVCWIVTYDCDINVEFIELLIKKLLTMHSLKTLFTGYSARINLSLDMPVAMPI
jgi:hypothetical protein